MPDLENLTSCVMCGRPVEIASAAVWGPPLYKSKHYMHHGCLALGDALDATGVKFSIVSNRQVFKSLGYDFNTKMGRTVDSAEAVNACS